MTLADLIYNWLSDQDSATIEQILLEFDDYNDKAITDALDYLGEYGMVEIEGREYMICG